MNSQKSQNLVVNSAIFWLQRTFYLSPYVILLFFRHVRKFAV